MRKSLNVHGNRANRELEITREEKREDYPSVSIYVTFTIRC